MLGASSPSGSIISLLEALSACWKHYLSCWKHYRPAGSTTGLLEALPACWKHRCLLGLGRAEEIAAILQEFRLNESTSR
ncbi:MAG: hypothetical protein E6230_17510, partial [Paenibacillus dendritiformis]|nr:hypothetical protein [Paenibacillus dendritiformis]